MVTGFDKNADIGETYLSLQKSELTIMEIWIL